MTRRALSAAGHGARPRILVVEPEPQLADRIRAAAAAIEPVPEVVARPRLRGSELASMSGFQVLIVGPSLLDRAGFHRLATVARKSPSTAVVMVIDQRPQATLKEIIQVGAVDAIPVDIGDDELGLALERIVTLGYRRSGGTTADLSAPAVRGEVITIASPTEGCGKTFVAANTAFFLARTGARVVLVDLDLQFGEVRTTLRARADFSIVDAVLTESDGQDLDALLPELLVSLPLGFDVLAAPRDPADADRVGPGDVARVIDALRARADYVVVDTPTGLAAHVLPVLDVTDRLLTVGTPDRPSLHNMGVFLRTLDRLGLASDVALVLNKAETDTPDLPEHLPDCLRAVLPYDRDVPRSINHGVPILEAAPGSPAARKLLGFLERLVPAPLPATSPSAPDGNTIRPTGDAPAPVMPEADDRTAEVPSTPTVVRGDWRDAPVADIDAPEKDAPETDARDEISPALPRLAPEAAPVPTGRLQVYDDARLPPARLRRHATVGPTRTGPHRRRLDHQGECRTRAPPPPGRRRPPCRLGPNRTQRLRNRARRLSDRHRQGRIVSD